MVLSYIKIGVMVVILLIFMMVKIRLDILVKRLFNFRYFFSKKNVQNWRREIQESHVYKQEEQYDEKKERQESYEPLEPENSQSMDESENQILLMQNSPQQSISSVHKMTEQMHENFQF